MPLAAAQAASSTLGLRAAWTCAACGASETTRQLAHFAAEDELAFVLLDPPSGWTVEGEAAYCAAHSGKRTRA